MYTMKKASLSRAKYVQVQRGFSSQNERKTFPHEQRKKLQHVGIPGRETLRNFLILMSTREKAKKGREALGETQRDANGHPPVTSCSCGFFSIKKCDFCDLFFLGVTVISSQLGLALVLFLAPMANISITQQIAARVPQNSASRAEPLRNNVLGCIASRARRPPLHQGMRERVLRNPDKN